MECEYLKKLKKLQDETRGRNDSSFYGRKHSQKTIEKIKLARAKQVNSEEYRIPLGSMCRSSSLE